MKASDVMTRDIISVKPDASVFDAARLMLERNISGVPVTDGAGHLVGIVTEGDFLRRTEMGTQRHRPRWIEFIIGPGKLADEYVHSSGRKVSEVMTPDVYTVQENTPLDEVVRQMERHRIKRLPVMRGNTIVGIVSRSNLIRAFANIAREVKPLSADDAAIRERLLSQLSKERWAPVGTIDIFVRDGVVTLSGAIMDDRERQALHVAAENMPGVKKVEDHLVWIDPTSGMAIEAEPT